MSDWKQTPEILAARDIAKRFGKTHVVIIMIDDRASTIQSASYGADGPRCKRAAQFATLAYDAIAGEIEMLTSEEIDWRVT